MNAVDVIRARRNWAASLIRQASGQVVAYGSPEWLALPEGSAEKVAAVIVAAESWQVDADDLAERLRHQLETERQAFKRTDDAEYQARALAHRAQWRHLSLVPARYVGQEVRPLEQIGSEFVAGLQRGSTR